MPIRMIAGDYRARPAFFCDACGQEIVRYENGNYHWNDGGIPYFSCKDAWCAATVDRKFKTISVMDLEDFLVALFRDMKFHHNARFQKDRRP